VGLLEEVGQVQAERRVGGVCTVKRVLETLEPADRDDLIAVLAKDKSEVMDATIVRVLKARDIHVGRESISNHRAGVCKCR
jgi:hypothetical protein